MSIKEFAIDSIQRLPESASWQDIEERIQFLAGISKAQEEVRHGQFISHHELKLQLAEWLAE
jgi:hypothetical protein